MAFNQDSILTVQPIPGLSDEVNQTRLDTAEIVGQRIIPNEDILARRWSDNTESKRLWTDITDEVKERKLWAPHLPLEYGGSDLGFLSHA